MLANFFGKSKPVNFIIIIVLFLMYYGISLFATDFAITQDGFIVNSGISLLLCLVLFFLFNFILTKNKLTHDNSYAFLLFVGFLGMMPVINLNYDALFVYIIILFSLRRVYSIKSSKSILEKLFDSGFWFGIAFLLEPSTIVFGVLIYSAIALFLKITLRTILIPIIGFVTPVFLYFTYGLFFDMKSVSELRIGDLSGLNYEFYQTEFYSIILGAMLLLVLASIMFSAGRIFSVSNKFKRSWVLVLLNFISAIFFIGLVHEKTGVELMMVFIPASIIIANWIQFVEKKLVVNILLLLFLLFSFAMHFII